MTVPEQPLWKTQQVAKALGLSVSTVKRLVDSGLLKAARTAGRHRLIPPSEALRFAREQDLPHADLECFLEEPTPDVFEVDEARRDALILALRRGRAEEVRDLIQSTYAAGGHAVLLADQLIRPAMQRIGHDWGTGILDVFQEHRATRLIESALTDLINQRIRVRGIRSAAAPTPLAIGASPEGDPYTLPGLLCELALRELGWEVMNLGPNLPLASLAKAVQAHQPRLVWLSISYLADPERFARDYESFYTSASTTGAAVILGGQALGPDLRARLVAASFGERIAHLVEFARRLQPGTTRSSTDRPDLAQP